MKLPVLSQKRISDRAIAWLCVVVLLFSLLPLYWLAFYAHASYDDLGFSVHTHEAWLATGSLPATIKAAFENTVIIRSTWEGTYATSFISALQPALFGGQYYWVTTLVLLTFLLGSVWYFLRRVLCDVLHAEKTTFWMAFCALSFVLIQFVPNLSEAFFWFNGGVAYTLMWSFMLLRLGVWVSFLNTSKPVMKILRGVLLLLLSFIVGGAKYSTALLAVLADFLIVLWVFGNKRKEKWVALLMTVVLTAGFVFSMTARGNAVRAQTLMGGMSPVKAIAQAFYFGIALIGHWFSLPLVVVWSMAMWKLKESIRGCASRFNHPIWVTVFALCLFCAQLTPTLVTGNYLGDGRSLNTYFYTFVILSCAIALYWMGWGIRRWEAKHDGEAPYPAIGTAPKDGLRIGVFALAVVLMMVGCLAYNSQDDRDEGLLGLSSVSSLRSLLNGQAARFDESMTEREKALADETTCEVILHPVEDVPDAFMGDVLDEEHIDYVVSLYETYFNKQTVRTEVTEDAP